jgi:hypothetical protein
MADLHNEPTVDWLIPGWLPARELSCVWGQPGSFKSFLAQNWSLQLAASERLAVYVAAEGTSGLAIRVAAWNAINHRDPQRDDPMWCYMPSNVNVHELESRRRFMRDLEDYLGGTPDLVVLDTMARNFVGGDENSAKDVGQFVEGAEEIRRGLDTAVLVIHHAGLTTGRERGTAALRAATFAMFQCSDLKQTRHGMSVKVECDRMKDAEKPDAVRVDFRKASMGGEFGDVMKTSFAMRQFPEKARAKGVPVSSDEDED